MPDNDTYLTDLRASGHKVRLYFGKFNGSVVWAATVDTTPTDKALNLTVTTVSGSSSDAKRGFMVRVETAGGSFKGMTNVRAAGTISSTNLPLHELPQADIAIVATDVVKVYNIPYLGDKLPVDAAGFAPDSLTYSDQGTAVPPRVNSGGHFIGFVDSGQTYATVATRGNLSTAEDPDSAGTITHVWTLLTGTLAFAPGSSSTDENPTIRASVGYGIAEHAVTDSSNSKSWSQFVCFQVYNDANPPYRLIDGDLSADEVNGWSGTFQTYANSTLTDLFDGQFVGVFARETINGSTVSYGTDIPNRAHIKLLGFLHHDENALEPQIRRIHFSIQSPWQRLAGLPGFSKVFTRSASDWTLIEDLTIRLSILHLIRYYSFYMEFFDVRFDSAFLNKAYPKLYINKQTADKQILELADGVDARVTCLRTGEMLIHTHPAYIPLSSRSGVTTTLTIAERDCITAPFTRDHWKAIETFELRGFIAATTEAASTPVFSRYPGLTPGRGAQSMAAERIVADDQTDANNRCGRRAALADGVYKTSTNVQYRAVEWDVTLPGSYDVFDFNKEYIATSLGTSTNLRGVDLSALKFYMTRIRITYSGGTARVNPTFATATNAPAGATYIPATENSPPYTPPDNVPIPPVGPPPTIPPYYAGMPTKGVLCSRTDPVVTLVTTMTIGVSTITLGGEDRSGNLASLGVGHCVWGYSDPYHYKRFYLLTDIGLLKNDDISTSSTWTLLWDNLDLYGNASYVGHQCFGSHMVNGWGVIACGQAGLVVTTDGWNTITQYGIGGTTNFASTYFHSGQFTNASVWLCGHDPNHFYAMRESGTSVGLWRSTDGCATWSSVSCSDTAGFCSGGLFFNNQGQCSINIPYSKPGGAPNLDNGSLWIEVTYGAYNFPHGIPFLMSRNRCTACTGTTAVFTQIAPGEVSMYGRICNPINYYTHDANDEYYPTAVLNGSNYDSFRLTSTDDAAATQDIDSTVIAWTNDYDLDGVSINGWTNPNVAVAFNQDTNAGHGGARLWMTFDHGVTWYPCDLTALTGWASTDGVAYAEFSLFTVPGMS